MPKKMLVTRSAAMKVSYSECKRYAIYHRKGQEPVEVTDAYQVHISKYLSVHLEVIRETHYNVVQLSNKVLLVRTLCHAYFRLDRFCLLVVGTIPIKTV